MIVSPCESRKWRSRNSVLSSTIVLRDEQMRTFAMTTLLAVGLLLVSSSVRAQSAQPAPQPGATLAVSDGSTAAGADATPLARQIAKSRRVPVQLQDTSGAETAARQPPPPILPGEFVPAHLANRAMSVMGLLIIACIGAIWYGQRYSRAGRSGNSAGDMKVLETLSIAPRCCVHLLTVGGQKYLVARDQAGIKSVTAVSAFATTLDDLADRSVEPAQDATPPSVTNRSWASRSDQWASTLNR